MANVIIKDEGREREVEHILRSYNADRNDTAMREAAEVMAARTAEAMAQEGKERRYY